MPIMLAEEWNALYRKMLREITESIEVLKQVEKKHWKKKRNEKK